MKRHLRLLAFCGLAAGTLPMSMAHAQAPTWFGNAADGTWYLGGRIATIQNGFGNAGFNSAEQASVFSDAQSIAVYGGYEFSRNVAPHGTVAVEFELYSSVEDGQANDARGSWKTNGVGAYAVWRSAGDIYLKTKIGIHNSRVTVDNGPSRVATRKDTMLGYGVGLGLRLKNNSAIELEFSGGNGIDLNDTQTISLGGHVNF